MEAGANQNEYNFIRFGRCVERDKEKLIVPVTLLPTFGAPRNLEGAANRFKHLDGILARSLDEHAWQAGCLFIWVKKYVGHGKFENWVKDHTQWTGSTARRYMQYARDCTEAGTLKSYHPKRSKRQNAHYERFKLAKL